MLLFTERRLEHATRAEQPAFDERQTGLPPVHDFSQGELLELAEY
jgi:hypothetical protein